MFEPQLIKRFGFLIILLCFIKLKTEGQNDLLSNAIEIEESIESIIAANPDLSDAQLNEITERLNAIYQSKVDINTIKTLLGHSKIETTMVYLHLQTSKRQQIISPLDALNKTSHE